MIVKKLLDRTNVVEESSNVFLSEHDIPSLNISDVTNYDISTNDIDVDAILNAPILLEDELSPITIRRNVSPKQKNGTNNMININDLSDVNETILGDDLVSITTNEDISERPTSHETKCTNDTIIKLMIESVPTTTKGLNNSGVVNVLGDEKLNTEERSVPITTSEDLFDQSPLKDLNSNQKSLSIPSPFKKALFWTLSQDKKKRYKAKRKRKNPSSSIFRTMARISSKERSKKAIGNFRKRRKEATTVIKAKRARKKLEMEIHKITEDELFCDADVIDVTNSKDTNNCVIEDDYNSDFEDYYYDGDEHEDEIYKYSPQHSNTQTISNKIARYQTSENLFNKFTNKIKIEKYEGPASLPGHATNLLIEKQRQNDNYRVRVKDKHDRATAEQKLMDAYQQEKKQTSIMQH
ncbi:hypothetical protein RN001_002417 [Aquatica leii]|uniref:Uncharacterized protein n=1 Tax=Aquatica leii TaxID=1421715 RepID=A0AAN7PPU4_9COLE|nr:hypothetical protein RN001_002417 [Aquatica leii]